MPDLAEHIVIGVRQAAKRGASLYLQFMKSIEEVVKSGLIGTGDALPSVRDIAARADVSRVTLRKSAQHLVKGGVLVQRHGSGTYVAPHVVRIEQSLLHLKSFTEDMARHGMSVHSEWLERGLFAPSPNETMALGLSANEHVARIERLRIASGTPLAIERASLSVAVLLDPASVDASLYSTLERGGNRPVRAVQRISAASLGEADARLLKVAAGSAGLNIQRISYLASGKVIEFTRSVYRGNAYDLVVELRLGETLGDPA